MTPDYAYIETYLAAHGTEIVTATTPGVTTSTPPDALSTSVPPVIDAANADIQATTAATIDAAVAILSSNSTIWTALGLLGVQATFTGLSAAVNSDIDAAIDTLNTDVSALIDEVEGYEAPITRPDKIRAQFSGIPPVFRIIQDGAALPYPTFFDEWFFNTFIEIINIGPLTTPDELDAVTLVFSTAFPKSQEANGWQPENNGLMQLINDYLDAHGAEIAAVAAGVTTLAEARLVAESLIRLQAIAENDGVVLPTSVAVTAADNLETALDAITVTTPQDVADVVQTLSQIYLKDNRNFDDLP